MCCGGFDLKDCKGTKISILYTSHDVEMLLGNGNLGFWRHTMQIENINQLIHAVQILIQKSKHMLDDKDVSPVLIMRALKSHLKQGDGV